MPTTPLAGLGATDLLTGGALTDAEYAVPGHMEVRRQANKRSQTSTIPPLALALSTVVMCQSPNRSAQLVRPSAALAIRAATMNEEVTGGKIITGAIN
jgi:hypothetical protein